METLRPFSILPAIKCSTCGTEIEISSMGDHVCASSQATTDSAPAAMSSPKQPNPPAISVQSRDSSDFFRPSTGSASISEKKSVWARAPKTALPRIDADAANKPYLQKEMLSPHPRGSGARSPLTPHTSNRPPRSPMTRSMTSPVPRIYRPPSPEMSSNIDCAFPRFPNFPKNHPRSSSSSSKPKNTSAFPRETGSNTLGARLHAEPESYTGPRSPRTTGGANVMQRMNTIAPGPFDTKSRASSEERGSSRRSPTPTPPTESAYIEAPASAPIQIAEQPKSPSDKAQPSQPSPVPFVAVSPLTNKEGRPVPQRPVRPEPLDGFLAMLKSETDAQAARSESPNEALRPGARSNTSPLPANAPDAHNMLSRTPSEPGLRDTHSTPVSPSSSAPTVPSSMGQLKVKTSKPDVPTMPPLSTLQARSYQQTVHTPSDSASSTSSYGTSSFRSDMSPTMSAASSVSMLSSALESAREQDPSLAVRSLQIRNKPSQSRLRTDEAVQTTPTPQEAFAYQVDSPPRSIASVSGHSDAPESPIVPVSQGLPRQQPPRCPPSPAPSGPLPPAPSMSPRSNPDDMASRSLTNKNSAKRPATATKHHCRGCQQPIVGKSVKAADGRLTGRYHRHCFVCKTCRSPFATADFYVINNDPYCEQHYHKLNDSLCTKCGRGIEGTYLETQQGQKFHPDCFTCLDCHKVLSDDYFELKGGSVYCEQHAFTELRRQEGLGPKRNMERRTTRLMMM